MLQEKILETRKAQAEKPAIVVRNVTKEFIIPHERRTTIFENIMGVFSPSTYEKFVAIKDVSFTVNRGESVGIIGDNGSGKSTLLKIISKILRPTSGSIEINGKITPFLELGVGFQPDMTAKENIEVYSTIMGMSDKEIAGNMDNVLEFAGLTNFRDTKLKNFSSGMQVRLAFATAIQREPDILLIDEVLAVGDMDFQQKCFDVFTEYKRKGLTMLFVSHDLNSVRKFCDKTLLLKDGQAVAFDETNSVIDKYIYESKPVEPAAPKISDKPAQAQNDIACEEKAENNEPAIKVESQNSGMNADKKVTIMSLVTIDKYCNINSNFATGDPMTIRVQYEIREQVDDLGFGIVFYNDAGIYCYGTTTKFKNLDLDTSVGTKNFDLVIDKIPMLDGRYYITIAAASHLATIFDWHDKAYSFVVHKETQDLGLFDIPCRFIVQDDDLR